MTLNWYVNSFGLKATFAADKNIPPIFSLPKHLNRTQSNLNRTNQTQSNPKIGVIIRLRFDCVRQSNFNRSIAFDLVRSSNPFVEHCSSLESPTLATVILLFKFPHLWLTFLKILSYHAFIQASRFSPCLF